MKISIFISKFKINLAEHLAAKTSWGRNDLMLVIERAITQTLAEMLE